MLNVRRRRRLVGTFNIQTSKPVLCEGITKQQTWLLALLGFPFSEVDHVHVPAETHGHGTAVPPAHSSIVIRIRTVTRVIIRVWAKGRSLVRFPHKISRRV